VLVYKSTSTLKLSESLRRDVRTFIRWTTSNRAGRDLVLFLTEERYVVLMQKSEKRRGENEGGKLRRRG